MTSVNAKLRREARAAGGDTDAREALLRYLVAIFPQHSRAQLITVADHQIGWMRQQGFEYRAVEKAAVVLDA